MESNLSLVILKKYLDYAFINSILSLSHYEYYHKIIMIIMIPTVIGSALLTILNTADINENIMKYLNISINGLNTLIITLSNNYKLQDRYNLYKSQYDKYNKLAHKIESIINNSTEISNNTVNDIITEYDSLVNDNIYSYLSSYKNKVILKYKNNKQLPNSLALESSSIMTDIVSIKD